MCKNLTIKKLEKYMEIIDLVHTQNFEPLDTYMYVCVSGVKRY